MLNANHELLADGFIMNSQFRKDFAAAYRELEGRMKLRAEADGDVFLPNPQPLEPVHHILICMEPSLGAWARSVEQAQLRVQNGFRNFLASTETMILHFCASHFLCLPGQLYHITDFSKGAMLVKNAGKARADRYSRWYPLLLEEIELLARSDCKFVAVGKAVYDQLKEHGFQRPLITVLHYSGQAAASRVRAIAGQEESFDLFKNSISMQDLVQTAHQVLDLAQVPELIRGPIIQQLQQSTLTASRLQLMFHYKMAFEKASL